MSQVSQTALMTKKQVFLTRHLVKLSTEKYLRDVKMDSVGQRVLVDVLKFPVANSENISAQMADASIL